ncbi:MAG TPA: hypothetical protein VGN86_17240 [Pyrinomonadaceae bacterium]|nr:hypothetical protein [Pyrinomonadaceae bacterium]
MLRLAHFIVIKFPSGVDFFSSVNVFLFSPVPLAIKSVFVKSSDKRLVSGD